MALKWWLSLLARQLVRPARLPLPRRARLPLEVLEDRLAPASMATFFVDRLSSAATDGNVMTGQGSLAFCISQADAHGGANTIVFDPSVFGPGPGQARGVTLSSPLPTITDAMTIDGPAGQLTFVERDSTAGSFRLFDVAGSASVTLNNLDIRRGSVQGDGGGIFSQGALALNNCRVDDNSASGSGGGIASTGNLFLDGCTLDGNSAMLGSGLFVTANGEAGTGQFTNCTFGGSSVALLGAGGGYDLSLLNCTLDAGLFNQADTGSVTVRYQNTLFADPSGPNITVQGPGAVAVSLGHNLSTDASGNLSSNLGDQIDTDPLLGPLRDNGGPVPTRGLLPGSPALGAADSSAPAVDARGVSRPQNGAPDIGAFEARPFTVQASGFEQSTPAGTPFASPLRLRLLEGANPVEGATVNFSLAAGTASAEFPAGAVTARVTTDASGYATAPILIAGQQAGSLDAALTASGGLSASGTLFVEQPANDGAPQVDSGDDQFVTQGELFLRTISFAGAGTGDFSGSVDFGDGTPVEELQLQPDHTAILAHVFADEGSFVVTVRIDDRRGGEGVGLFFADVLLPGISGALKEDDANGNTLTLPDAVAQALSTDGTPQARIILADVPASTAARLTGTPISSEPTTRAASFDLRVVGRLDSLHGVLVSFHYPDNLAGQPLLTYYDPITDKQEPVSAQLLLVNRAQHRITILFDRLSSPGVGNLKRTVFTISVPTALPAATDQAGPLVVLAASVTLTQPITESSTSSSGQAGPTGPGTQGTQVAAAALGSLVGGANETSGLGRWLVYGDTGPLGELPPPPDSLIGLPPLAIVPSQLMAPAQPPTTSRPSPYQQETREQAPPDRAAPPAGWEQELDLAVPAEQECLSDLAFAADIRDWQSEDRPAVWLAATAALAALAPAMRGEVRGRLPKPHGAPQR